MSEAYIVSAARTPIGRFGGALSSLTASELGAVAIGEALKRANLQPQWVDEVFMGNVVQAGQGQNPARQAALKAGVHSAAPCITINMVCGSGLKAVVLAAQAIQLGEAGCIVAGGMESMSRSPYVLPRNRPSLGNLTLMDLVLQDGLLDAFDGRHMAQMCERLGERYGVTREQQDAYAALSQQRCEAAQRDGKFREEIVPITVKDRNEECVVEADEQPRRGTTTESLAKLRPAFEVSGCITAGNASGINDGAAAVVVASGEVVGRLGLPVLGRIVSWASAGTEPELFGIASAGAVRLALEKAGLALGDIELIEANEAFAVQMLALSQEVGWPMEKVNVNGGAIALGHPIGASGARILITLLFEMRRCGKRYGLATLCCGGGMGIAMVVEAIMK